MNNLNILVEHFAWQSSDRHHRLYIPQYIIYAATRKPIDLLHDLSLFYALQKYFLKSSAIAPLAVSVESCVQLQLWREKEQFSSG